MSITQATVTDVPALNKLVNSAYRGETSKQGWTTEANLLDGLRIDEETMTGYFSDPNIIILKHTDDAEEITGCVYLELRAPKLYVGMFSVSPVLQGKGVGRALLEAAESYAKQLHCTTLTMTVISIRTELIAWYQRRGYLPTGATEPYPTDHELGRPLHENLHFIVMEKPIL